MKIVVAVNGDGHFMAASLYDREKVEKIIGDLQDGDFVANMSEEEKIVYDNIIYENPAPVSNITWRDFVYGLQQRGTIEIIEL